MGNSRDECDTCRGKFTWVDGSTDVPNFWGFPLDPVFGERCVRLRHPVDETTAWGGLPCISELKYICKAGKLKNCILFWSRFGFCAVDCLSSRSSSLFVSTSSFILVNLAKSAHHSSGFLTFICSS